MASPVADSYSVASGGGIYGGRYNWPAWAESLAPMTWAELPGTNFLTWANANIPAGAYQGGMPFKAIVDAFCDGVFDPSSGKAYLYGGGHGDGTCNAVIEVDHATPSFSLAGQPTPPAKYPPSYVNGGTNQPGPLVYPSGAGPFSHFQDDLTDPLDTAYNTPLARASSHMYAASAVRNGVVHFFYGGYAEFNAAAGTWANVDGVDFGAQLYAISTNYNDGYLQQGTAALYDAATDRFYVTCIPGDAGGGWRSHLLKINPTTRVIESMVGILDYLGNALISSSQMFQHGRKIYVFFLLRSSTITMDTGRIYDIDTGECTYFRCAGDALSVTAGTTVECIPGTLFNGSVYRWNYASASDRGYLYQTDLTPASGAGTQADPYVLTQTKQVTGGTAPSNGLLLYRRLWCDASGAMIIMPRADSNLYALRLT
jgi:hypothetical protein